MGGDEFLVILPMTTCEEAQELRRPRAACGEPAGTHPSRVRAAFAQHGHRRGPPACVSPDTILGAADAALCTGPNEAGRDSVETAPDP